jgi:hypothetical protein
LNSGHLMGSTAWDTPPTLSDLVIFQIESCAFCTGWPLSMIFLLKSSV